MRRMRLRSTQLSLVALVACGLFVAGCEQPAPTAAEWEEEALDQVVSQDEVIPGQYIVVLREQEGAGKTGRQALNDVVSLEGVEAQRYYERTVLGFAGRLTDEAVERLRRDDRVKYVEPDRMITLAPPCWVRGTCDDDGGGGSGEQTPAGITRVGGGATYTGSNVAWILDSGIDLDHEDLNVDASRGFNAFTSGRDGKSLDDGNGHGTHVAGTVAAIDNAVGVVGVAAGATVVPVKVLGSNGSGSYSGVIDGIDHVGANGRSGDVANMSLGGSKSQAVNDAVVAAAANGIKFVLAAGNDGADANDYSPASANGANVYTISAVDANDRFASFSNYGNPPVDYAAPGVSIYSTYKDGGYRTLSGTSMAAPHAAGVLLWGNPSSSGTAKNDPDGNADPIISRGSGS